MTTVCEYCEHHPTPAGIRLCHDCLTRFEQTLDLIPDLLKDAQATLALQHQNATTGAANTSGPASTKAPINLGLHEELDKLTTALGKLVVMLTGAPLRHTHNPTVAAPLRHTHNPTVAAQIIRHNTNHYRTTPGAAPAMWDTIHHTGRAYRLVDRPADIISYGDCPTPTCPGTLTAEKGATHAQCRTCRATINTHQHLDQQLRDSWHTPAPLHQVIKALKVLGHPIPYSTAKSWVQRGKLTTPYVTRDGKPGYTIAQLYKQRQYTRNRK